MSTKHKIIIVLTGTCLLSLGSLGDRCLQFSLVLVCPNKILLYGRSLRMEGKNLKYEGKNVRRAHNNLLLATAVDWMSHEAKNKRETIVYAGVGTHAQWCQTNYRGSWMLKGNLKKVGSNFNNHGSDWWRRDTNVWPGPNLERSMFDVTGVKQNMYR